MKKKTIGNSEKKNLSKEASISILEIILFFIQRLHKKHSTVKVTHYR